MSDLIKAVIENDIPRIAELLLSGSDPNACEDEAGVTPLHHAVSCGHYEATLLLLTSGAHISAEQFFDLTPLSVAQDRGKARIYDLLMRLNPHSASSQ